MRRLVCLFAILVAFPLHAAASASPKAIAVLDQEDRWLNAIGKGDAKALGAILAENFVHIDYKGRLSYREDALASLKKLKPYKQSTGEQTVDFAGNAAIVHGINTVTQGGKTVLRLRYTDVYVLQSGRWLAVSAQETAIP